MLFITFHFQNIIDNTIHLLFQIILGITWVRPLVGAVSWEGINGVAKSLTSWPDAKQKEQGTGVPLSPLRADLHA